MPNRVISEIVAFLRRHWLHVLFLVPGALLVTAVHEAAHSAAVIAQGGQVLEFVWVPSSVGWGHMRYEFPAGARYSSFAISVAPYILWLFVAAVAALLSLRRRAFRPWVASTLFLWVFVLPLADIANAVFPYAAGGTNDLLNAFGDPTSVSLALAVLATAVSILAGFLVQRRLYRDLALSRPAYAILCIATVAAIVAVSCF